MSGDICKNKHLVIKEIFPLNSQRRRTGKMLMTARGGGGEGGVGTGKMSVTVGDWVNVCDCWGQGK